MTQMTQPTLNLDRDDLFLILDAIVTRRGHIRSIIKSIDEADEYRSITDRYHAELGQLLGIQDRVLEVLNPLTKV